MKSECSATTHDLTTRDPESKKVENKRVDYLLNRPPLNSTSLSKRRKRDRSIPLFAPSLALVLASPFRLA